MKKKSEVFRAAVVLSVYHNRLLCHFGELRGLLDFVTGHEVALWEIPRARALTAEHLRRQYPWLARIEPPPGFKTDAVNVNRFVNSVIREVGAEQFKVYPLPRGTFVPHGPFERAN